MLEVMMFNATFNNISAISWWSALLVQETGENLWPATSHWQTLAHIFFYGIIKHTYKMVQVKIKEITT